MEAPPEIQSVMGASTQSNAAEFLKIPFSKSRLPAEGKLCVRGYFLLERREKKAT